MPAATPESAVNKNYLGNEKDVGAVLSLIPPSGSGKTYIQG